MWSPDVGFIKTRAVQRHRSENWFKKYGLEKKWLLSPSMREKYVIFIFLRTFGIQKHQLGRYPLGFMSRDCRPISRPGCRLQQCVLIQVLLEVLDLWVPDVWGRTKKCRSRWGDFGHSTQEFQIFHSKNWENLKRKLKYKRFGSKNFAFAAPI